MKGPVRRGTKSSKENTEAGACQSGIQQWTPHDSQVGMSNVLVCRHHRWEHCPRD